tara:strand:- start:1023 stop:2306 length:1284 start_codon:yes stop_codon:yes gene_type:complete
MATVKKTSRNYVNSVLDAAAMASRADTLDGMLRDLPGLLMQQEQQKRAEETEAERYNEQMDIQRQARIDNKNREEEAADYQFLNVAVSIDDPIERAAMIAGYSPKTDRGRMGFDSLSASNAVVTGVDSNINASMKELNDEKANLSAEEYNARVLELENEINKSTYLQNKYKTGLKSYKDFGIKISGREYANELVDSNIFNITDEEKKELKETIQFSSNPVEDITVLLDKLDTKEMTEKEYASAISDLGNTAAQLENAGDTAGASTVRAYQNRLISQSSGSTKDDGEVGEVQNLTESEKAAMKKQYGNQSMILIPDSANNSQILVNMDEGTQQDVSSDYKIPDANKGVKTLEQERDEYKVLFDNAKSQQERTKYRQLLKETNKKIKEKQQSEKSYVQKRKDSFNIPGMQRLNPGAALGLSFLERRTRQ